MEQSLAALPDVALFVEVARSGSFRAAAARLEIPPATLSRRIAAMESRLGVTLFRRTTRAVALTESARPYYERCLDVLDAATRAHDALVAGRDRQARVRIAMPVDLGVTVLGPIVAAFGAAHPDLRIDLDLSSRAVDLHRDPVDLAFRIGRPLDERVVARRIADVGSGLYAAPALLRRLPPLTEAGRLTAMPCLDLRTAAGSMPWSVGSHRWATAPGPCTLSANSVALLCSLAEQGRGVALLPEHIAEPRVHARRLARVLAGETTPVWPLYAITAGRTVPRRVALLIAHVRGALARAPLASRPAGGRASR